MWTRPTEEKVQTFPPTLGHTQNYRQSLKSEQLPAPKVIQGEPSPLPGGKPQRIPYLHIELSEKKVATGLFATICCLKNWQEMHIFGVACVGCTMLGRYTERLQAVVEYKYLIPVFELGAWCMSCACWVDTRGSSSGKHQSSRRTTAAAAATHRLVQAPGGLTFLILE